MTYDVLGPGALDYLPCRYGTSKLTFRGPQRGMEAPYVAFIGGTQTFGKFIEQPFPLRVEHLTGVTSVNFGQVGAGLDVFATDPVVQEAARHARVTVVEVLGAANMNNPLYKVHQRRNDRFVWAAKDLRDLYPEVDFAQFNFTQHMLRDLHSRDAERFAQVLARLRRVWVRRMGRFLGNLKSPVVLVSFPNPDFNNAHSDEWSKVVGSGPAFVTVDMVAALKGRVSGFVEVPVLPGPDTAQEGLVFNPLEEAAAKLVATPAQHQLAADALRPVLDELM